MRVSTLAALAAFLTLGGLSVSHAAVTISDDFNSGLPANAATFGNTSAIVAPLTADDFDAPGTAKTFAGSGSQAVVSGGPTGDFLRLAPATNGQNNQVAYDRTAAGAATRIVADFDFRMANPNNNGADGLGFAILGTGAHGTTGAGPGFNEEANVPNSFGVGFDIWSNSESSDNHVSIHYDGSQVGSNFDLNKSTQIDFEGSQFNHANIDLTWVKDSEAVATVTLTPDSLGTPGTPVVLSQTITGVSPYEGRLALNGRTGGANADHDIDNIRVDFGPIDQGGIQLVPAANSQAGGLAFDDPTGGDPISQWLAEFDFRSRVGGDDRGADGFSLSFVRGDDVGTASETGRPSGLAVGFDTFDNGAVDPSGNHVEIRFDGTVVPGGTVDLNPLGINLEDGFVHNASVFMGSDGLDLIIDGTPILTDLSIPGFEPYAGRFNFGARTGGAVANFYVDNFSASLTNVPEPITLLVWSLLASLGITLGWRRRKR